jgi:hypothetical protein
LLQKLTLIALTAFVAGCTDPKTANENNFGKAIQSYLDTVYPKCYFLQKFPATVDFDIGGTQATLKALVKAGLVSEKEESRREIADLFGGGKKTYVKTSFDLTDAGRKVYKLDAVKTLRGDSVGGFCFGKASVKDVSQFSEPSDMLGQKISRVNYTYVVTDLPAWAKTPEMLAAIKALDVDAKSVIEPVKALDTLLLTNNGWVHERLFQK